MRIVVIGSSIAACSVIKNLRRNGFEEKITCITRDAIPFYSRIPLPDVIAGKRNVKDIIFCSEKEQGIAPIELISKQSVVGLEPKRQSVRLSNGSSISYDSLIICTGANAKEPPAEIKCPGVFTLRNIEDAIGIKEYAKNIDTATVIGGGLVGLKAATSLLSIGLKVKLIIKSPHILSRNVDDKAASLLQGILQKNGLEIITGCDVVAVNQKDGRLDEVVLDNGEVRKTEMMIYGKGVRSNLGFLSNSGIICDRGIVADKKMMTNIEGIYTAGDVAYAPDYFTGKLANRPIWPEAVRQGQVVARTILGIHDEYEGSIPMNIMELCGVPFASIGQTESGDNDECIIYYFPERNIYKKAVFWNKQLLGVVLVGDVKMAGTYYTLIKKKIMFESPKEIFISPYKTLYGDAIRKRKGEDWV